MLRNFLFLMSKLSALMFATSPLLLLLAPFMNDMPLFFRAWVVYFVATFLSFFCGAVVAQMV